MSYYKLLPLNPITDDDGILRSDRRETPICSMSVMGSQVSNHLAVQSLD